METSRNSRVPQLGLDMSCSTIRMNHHLQETAVSPTSGSESVIDATYPSSHTQRGESSHINPSGLRYLLIGATEQEPTSGTSFACDLPV